MMIKEFPQCMSTVYKLNSVAIKCRNVTERDTKGTLGSSFLIKIRPKKNRGKDGGKNKEGRKTGRRSNEREKKEKGKKRSKERRKEGSSRRS